MVRTVKAALFLLFIALAAGPAGCGRRSPKRDQARDHAAELMALMRAEPGQVGRIQAELDALVGMGERARPGIEWLMCERLKATLDSKSRRNMEQVIDMVVSRATWPSEPWAKDEPWPSGGGDEARRRARRVRQPWLGAFLLKLVKHHLTDTRAPYMSLAVFHCPGCAADLVWFVESDVDPFIRALATHLLGESSTLAESQLAGVLARVAVEDEHALPRTAAVTVAAKARLKWTIPTLVRLLVDDTGADMGFGAPFDPDRRVLWGVRQGAVGAETDGFRVTIGQLAAYAIQQITGRDFGFKSCYESRNDMPKIIQRIRAALPEQRPNEQ